MKRLLFVLLLLVVACSGKLSQTKPVVSNQPASKGVLEMQLSSPAFERNSMIPAKYTCDGANINPALAIQSLPKEAKSLVLIVDDPDAAGGTWDHWVVWNIVPTEKIDEDSVPGTEGLNSFKKHQYDGPCPPSGIHRYFFKVYALDARLNISDNSAKKDVEKAMQSHIIAKAELIGIYQRQ